MGMPISGKKNMIDSLHWPMNHKYLNATHPAMLAVHRFNSDVQLPYRLPIVQGSRADVCEDATCMGQDNFSDVARAAQMAQDAQAGYCCDYCCKRQPLAFNEVKECCKGHGDLHHTLPKDNINYIGKRHAMRLMSDAYGKGIVRGQVECANLRAFYDARDVLKAEAIRSAAVAVFYGREYLDTVRLLCKERTTQKRPYFFSIDGRNPKKKCVTVRDVGLLYGHRPQHASVWTLSPYEFMMQWEPVMASYPRTALEDQKLQHHASLTDEGLALANSKSIPVDEKKLRRAFIM